MGDAEGAEPEESRLSVEQATEDARCVEGRDTEPFDRSVGRHEGARVAVGEERVIGDRRKRRGRGRALRRGLGGGLIARHVVIQGPCQRPWPATSSSAAAGPQRARLVWLDRWWRVEQRLHDPPRLLDAVLSREARALTRHRGVQEHLVGRCALAALLGELHVQGDRLCYGRVGAACIDDELDAGRRIELDHDLVRFGPSFERLEAEAGRMLEHESQLGLQSQARAFRFG